MPNRKLVLETRLLAPLLFAVEQGRTQADYCRELKVLKGTASKRFKTAEGAGLIRCTSRDAVRNYELTEAGKLLVSSFKTPLNMETFKYLIRYEHLFFTSDLQFRDSSVGGKRGDDFFVKLAKGGFVVSPRRHFKGWQVEKEDATIFVSGTKVWFLVKPIWAASIVEALEKALSLVEKLRCDFVTRFGVRLGRPDEVVKLTRQEMALLGGMTKQWSKHYFRQNERIKIDSSTGVPEIETRHKTLAVEDMDRVFKFQDAVARGEINSEDWQAVKETVASIPWGTLAEFAESLRKPKIEPDWRDRI